MSDIRVFLSSERVEPVAAAVLAARMGRRRWIRTLALGGLGLGLPSRQASAANETPLQTRLQELGQWVKQRGGVLGASLVDLESGTPLAELNADQPLNPASNMKLITAAAALDLMGPQTRFRTGVYGRLQGAQIPELTLRGDGDPALGEADLWRLADAIAAMGATSIGALYVDQSRFDDQFVPPAFEQQPKEWASFRAPVSAIAVERNTVTLNVLPQVAGQPARVWFQPAGVMHVSGKVMTSQRGSGQAIQWKLEPAGQQLHSQLGGRVAEGLGRQRFQRRMDDPRLVPGLVLKHQLMTLGVKVGTVQLGGSHLKARLAYVSSPPLSELLKELGKHSDNFYAEMIFKALAAGAPSTGDGKAPDPASGTSPPPYSTAVAARRVQEWLARAGPLPEATRVLNGSGLFDANRVSASTLVHVLAQGYRSPKLRNEFVSQLAIGGVDGTLLSRFRKQRDSRAIRAKTGTLNKVIALSGYVLRPGTRSPVAFSFMVNGIAGQHRAIRNKIDKTLAPLLSQ